MQTWPDKCEKCSEAATQLFALTGSRATAMALCNDHHRQQREELKQWAATNGNNYNVVMLPRCEAAENIYAEIKGTGATQ